MSAKERELAHNKQEKFEFYLISLVFTLLALSIQTAQFGALAIANIFELAGWLGLLASGIAGLWRLEYISLELVKRTQQDEFENKIFELKKLQLKGVDHIYVLEKNSDESISERIASFERAVTVLGPVIHKLMVSNQRKYSVHRYLFVVALVCLLVSRAYAPVGKLLGVG